MQFVKLMKLLNVSNFDVIVSTRENLKNNLASKKKKKIWIIDQPKMHNFMKYILNSYLIILKGLSM